MNSPLLRRIELQLLMNLTARAFGQPAPRIWTRPHEEALRLYAGYTRSRLQGQEADRALLLRMNQQAYRMGRLLRRILLIRSQARAERLTIQLYRNIGIELEGHIPGALRFRRCYFARFYTPAVCQAASALDDGFIRGLNGCGPIAFHQRITEGSPCCLAVANKPLNFKL